MNKVYLRATIATVLVAVVISSLYLYWDSKRKKTPAMSRINLLETWEKEGIPDFFAKTITGEEFQLASLKGKVVILNFWASWCGPCVEEFPSMIELIEAMDGKVQLVAVSEDSEVEEMNSFLKSFPKVKNPNIHLIFDEGKEIARLYNLDRLPESYITHPDLKMARKVIGSIEWNTDEARAYMQELLQ